MPVGVRHGYSVVVVVAGLQQQGIMEARQTAVTVDMDFYMKQPGVRKSTEMVVEAVAATTAAAPDQSMAATVVTPRAAAMDGAEMVEHRALDFPQLDMETEGVVRLLIRLRRQEDREGMEVQAS
jgi:hypothetical protein